MIQCRLNHALSQSSR